MPADMKQPRESISELAVPDKAALSNVTTVCDQSPRTDKLNPFETDIEAMMPANTTDTCTQKVLGHKRPSGDCQVWPDKKHWKNRAKTTKKQNRSCQYLSKLSRRNRIIAKVMIVVLVIGIAVAVGFGVSKPLNAPIWGDKNN